MGFSEYLKEKVSNVTVSIKDQDKKRKMLDTVWEHLQNSYKSIGGIKGSGFGSKEDLMTIPLWKVYQVNGEVKAGLFYKDKGSRKTVAVFTDGSKLGKEKLVTLLKDDFARSNIEVSDSLLNFLERKMPTIFKKYAVKSSEVEAILGKKIEIIDDVYYKREIGGKMIKKVMLGTTKKFKF